MSRQKRVRTEYSFAQLIIGRNNQTAGDKSHSKQPLANHKKEEGRRAAASCRLVVRCFLILFTSASSNPRHICLRQICCSILSPVIISPLVILSVIDNIYSSLLFNRLAGLGNTLWILFSRCSHSSQHSAKPASSSKTVGFIWQIAITSMYRESTSSHILILQNKIFCFTIWSGPNCFWAVPSIASNTNRYTYTSVLRIPSFAESASSIVSINRSNNQHKWLHLCWILASYCMLEGFLLLPTNKVLASTFKLLQASQ